MTLAGMGRVWPNHQGFGVRGAHLSWTRCTLAGWGSCLVTFTISEIPNHYWGDTTYFTGLWGHRTEINRWKIQSHDVRKTSVAWKNPEECPFPPPSRVGLCLPHPSPSPSPPASLHPGCTWKTGFSVTIMGVPRISRGHIIQKEGRRWKASCWI